MRLLPCILASILLAQSTIAVSDFSPPPQLPPAPSPSPSPLARRSPQRDEEDNISPDPPLDNEDFGPDGRLTVTSYVSGPRTTTIRGQPGRTSTITRRTTITQGGPSPTQLPAKQPGQCPRVWFDVSKELSRLFVDGPDCSGDARSAIRAVFHDCFPDGGCDGSLILNAEINRAVNQPMSSTILMLSALALRYQVSAADMLVFASSHAVVSCPGGPIVRTFIGRDDSERPAPDNQLPPHNAPPQAALAMFRSKGFTAQELAALLGAHSVSRQVITDLSKIGAPQDTTPGKWDQLYYRQTITGTAPFTFEADRMLSRQDDVGPWMSQFASDKGSWDRVFMQAMTKMQALGPRSEVPMVDCTAALPSRRGPSGPGFVRVGGDEGNSTVERRSYHGYHGTHGYHGAHR